MPPISPMCIGESVEDLFKGLPDVLPASEFFSFFLRSGRGLEHTIVSHVRHYCVDIMRIKSVGKGLEKTLGNFRAWLRHKYNWQKHEKAQSYIFHISSLSPQK